MRYSRRLYIYSTAFRCVLNIPFNAVLRNEWMQYMLEQSKLTPTFNRKIPIPPKQKLIDWIEKAWHHLKSNPDAVKKSLLVTGLSTVPGNEEEKYIRKDYVRQDIWQALQEESEDEEDPLQTSSDDTDSSDELEEPSDDN